MLSDCEGMMVSERLRREVFSARCRGVRQYQIARRARLHPTVLSALLNGAIPTHHDDERIIRVAEVLGIPASACFEEETTVA